MGLTSCVIPAVGKPNFSIEPGMMEVGIGHHGEPGIAVETLKPAADIAALMMDALLEDLPFERGDEIAVLVSGLGATPAMELYILFDHVARIAEAAGLSIYRPYVGDYFTSLEMMGATVTLTLDDELKACLDLEADSVGLRRLPA